jgi:hypothetical protein
MVEWYPREGIVQIRVGYRFSTSPFFDDAFLLSAVEIPYYEERDEKQACDTAYYTAYNCGLLGTGG